MTDLRQAMETALRERPVCQHTRRLSGTRNDWACAECDVDAIWPVVGAAVSAAQAEDCNEATMTALRALHWMTFGSDADGTLSGKPVCGCCAWLDGIRKPWPCDTLQAIGFTDDDAAAALARSVPGTTEGGSDDG